MDHESLVRLNQAQARLVSAVQELSLARSLTAVQEVVRKAAREIASADGATFVLREGDQCHYADEDAIAPLWKGRRFPMNACVSGWAMLNRASAVIPDIYADPRIPADAYRPTFVRGLVMVPIRTAAPVGAIGVYWARPHQASPEEVELVQALANTTAVAMENVRVYAELEQRVATRTAELSAANEELESFSSAVSHDLRAPLRAMGGFAELLSRRPILAGDAEARRYLDRIQVGAKQMAELIEHLLRLAQFTRAELHLSDADLAAIARNVTARLRQAEPDRTVEFVLPERLPLRCDPALMEVVLDNLLGNAWKYSSRRPKARIELGASESDGTRVFFVRDNGAGFDPSYASKLFAPFQRLHRQEEFPGSGIGLATVHRIILRHGGRIWAEAEVDRGATFRFTCPGPG